MKSARQITKLSAFAALGMALTLTACSTTAPQADESTQDIGNSAELQTMTLSIPPVGDSLPIYIALDEGYFEDEGLDITLVPAANGATSINAVVSASTDLALVSYPSLIVARASGIPVTIAALGVDGTEEYQAGIYTLEDSDIQSLEDIVGKRVAVPSLNSVGDIFLSGEFLANGLDPADIDYVELPQGNMASAISSGDVDAAFMTEPTLSSARQDIDIRLITYQEGPQGVFITSDSTLDANVEAVQGFRDAIARANEDIAKDPQAAATTYMPKHTEMSEETASTMGLPRYVSEWEAAAVQAQIDLMAKLDIIGETFDANDLYRTP